MPAPTRTELYGNLGRAIGESLRDRFHKHQFESFQENELAKFMSAAQEAQNAIAAADDPEKGGPEAMSAAFQKFKTAQSEFYTASSKYADNPYIAQVSQKIGDANVNGLETFMNLEAGVHARGQRASQEDLATRKSETEIKRGEAQTNLFGAQATEARSRASLLDRTDPNLRAAGAGSNRLPESIYYTEGVEDLSRLRAALYRPDRAEDRKSEQAQIRQDMAQRILQSQFLGKPKPGVMGEVWGNTPEDLAAVMANYTNESDVRREWEKSVLEREGSLHGLDSMDLQRLYPGLYSAPDQGQAAPEGVQPVVGRASSPEIAQMLFGEEVSAKIAGEGDTSSIRGIERSMPANLTELMSIDGGRFTAGPLMAPWAAALHFRGKNPVTGENWKSKKELRDFLEGETRNQITTYFGTATDKLSKSNRRDAESVARRIMDLYFNDLSDQFLLSESAKVKMLKQERRDRRRELGLSVKPTSGGIGTGFGELRKTGVIK